MLGRYLDGTAPLSFQPFGGDDAGATTTVHDLVNPVRSCWPGAGFRVTTSVTVVPGVSRRTGSTKLTTPPAPTELDTLTRCERPNPAGESSAVATTGFSPTFPLFVTTSVTVSEWAGGKVMVLVAPTTGSGVGVNETVESESCWVTVSVDEVERDETS